MVLLKRWVDNIAGKRDDLEDTLERERDNFETLLERAQAKADSGNSSAAYQILTHAEDIYWRDWSRGTLANKIFNVFYDCLEGKRKPYRNDLDEERIKRIKYVASRNHFIDNIKKHTIESNPQGFLESIKNFEDVILKELGFGKNWQAFESLTKYNEKGLQHDCYRARQEYLWQEVDKTIAKGSTSNKLWENLYYSLEKLSLLLEGSREHVRNLRIKIRDSHEKAYHASIDKMIGRSQYKLSREINPAAQLCHAENANALMVKDLERPAYRSEEIIQLKEQVMKLAS